MRVPLIGTIDNNTPETVPFPAIDITTRILFNEKDGMKRETTYLTKVSCLDQRTPDNQNGVYFDLEASAPDYWEATCTDNRIVFYCPQVNGLFGNKGKRKPMKCSAGHLYYSQIGGISTGYIDANSPLFAVSCVRADGTHSHIMMFSKDMGSLRNLALTVHANLSAYVERNALTDASVTQHIVDNWKSFGSNLWSDPNKDARFTVPTKGFSVVPVSRTSAM